MIVLVSPKGWTGPAIVDGKQVEGTFRAHQVPMGEMDKPEHIRMLEEWMRSYRPERAVRRAAAASAPQVLERHADAASGA